MASRVAKRREAFFDAIEGGSSFETPTATGEPVVGFPVGESAASTTGGSVGDWVGSSLQIGFPSSLQVDPFERVEHNSSRSNKQLFKPSGHPSPSQQLQSPSYLDCQQETPPLHVMALASKVTVHAPVPDSPQFTVLRVMLPEQDRDVAHSTVESTIVTLAQVLSLQSSAQFWIVCVEQSVGPSEQLTTS